MARSFRKGSFAQRMYIPRVIGSGIGFWAIAAVLGSLPVPIWLWVLLIFNGYIWPHIAFFLAKRVPVPYLVERRSLLMEAFLCGFWVAAMQFNALPTTMMISMHCMNSIAVGGTNLLRLSLLAQLAGTVIGCGLTGINFSPDTSYLQVYACLPMLAIYPMVVGGAAYRLAAKLAQHKRALRDFSRLDSLTGIFNHGAWKESLEAEFAHLPQPDTGSVLALIDIDHFKSINDTQSHLVGDEVIRLFSEVLKTNSRMSDITGRIGGDEFGVLFKSTTMGQAKQVLIRLQARLLEAFEKQAHLPKITLSIGIASYAHDLSSADAWLKRADDALYEAKRKGRNQIAECL